MEKITFTDASLVTQAKVTIEGVDHEVTPATYSGGTDLNASTFNTMQENIEDAIDGTLPVSLYDNQNGTNSNFILSDSADNYNYIEIFYGYGNSNFGNNSCKIYYPYQKNANLVLAIFDGITCQQMMTTLTISGINVTFSKTSIITLYNSLSVSSDSYIKVNKVLGYK